MYVLSRLVMVATLRCAFALSALMLGSAEAYVDPGTTGMLSQLLYILFYGLLGILLYCLRYIKQVLQDCKQYLRKLLGRKVDGGS